MPLFPGNHIIFTSSSSLDSPSCYTWASSHMHSDWVSFCPYPFHVHGHVRVQAHTRHHACVHGPSHPFFPSDSHSTSRPHRRDYRSRRRHCHHHHWNCRWSCRPRWKILQTRVLCGICSTLCWICGLGPHCQPHLLPTVSVGVRAYVCWSPPRRRGPLGGGEQADPGRLSGTRPCLRD
jgi:hypothetical protein